MGKMLYFSNVIFIFKNTFFPLKNKHLCYFNIEILVLSFSHLLMVLFFKLSLEHFFHAEIL